MKESGPSGEPETRLQEMEVRLAYQDHLLAELDGVVRGLGIQVQRLERGLAELQESVGEAVTGAADEAPPHY